MIYIKVKINDAKITYQNPLKKSSSKYQIVIKFAVITELQVDELNEFYHFAMTGISIDDDPFIFKA